MKEFIFKISLFGKHIILLSEALKLFFAHTRDSCFTVSSKDHWDADLDWICLSDGHQGLWKANQSSIILLEFYFSAQSRVSEERDDII